MMRLALTAADVTGPATEDHPEGQAWKSVSTVIRQARGAVPATLVLTSRAGVTQHTVEATAVRDGVVNGAKVWLVDTVAGTFSIARKRGCGCR